MWNRFRREKAFTKSQGFLEPFSVSDNHRARDSCARPISCQRCLAHIIHDGS
jgi:hypothetical protein